MLGPFPIIWSTSPVPGRTRAPKEQPTLSSSIICWGTLHETHEAARETPEAKLLCLRSLCPCPFGHHPELSLL